MPPASDPPQSGPRAEAGDLLHAAREVLHGTLEVAEASLALLRAELGLARSSAVNLVWLAFVLVFLGVGAWLATSAAIAVGLWQLTGNAFAGIGVVALGNLAGVAFVLAAMRRCWRDLGLPRTRELVRGLQAPSSDRPPRASAGGNTAPEETA